MNNSNAEYAAWLGFMKILVSKSYEEHWASDPDPVVAAIQRGHEFALGRSKQLFIEEPGRWEHKISWLSIAI